MYPLNAAVNCLDQEVGYGGLADYSPPTYKARLHKQRDELKSRLEKAENALTALENNPEIEAVLEAVMAAGY